MKACPAEVVLAKGAGLLDCEKEKLELRDYWTRFAFCVCCVCTASGLSVLALLAE